MTAKKIRTFLLSALILLLTAWTAKKIVSPTDYPNSDFFSFWLAGRMIPSDQNPYEAEGWVEAHHVYGAEWISDPTFLYPIPLAVFFIPLGLLDLYPAFVIWVWLSQVMLAVSLLLIFPSFGAKRLHYVVPVLAGLILFRPLIPLLVNGQLSALFLLAILLTGILWERGEWLWGGAVLSVLFLKPNIGIPILALVGLYLLVQKRAKAFIGMGIGALLLLILGLFQNPNWIMEYLQVLRSKQELTFGYSSTIWGVAALLGGFEETLTVFLGGLFTVCALIFYLFMLTRLKRLAPLHGISLAATTAILVTPYLWPYDQILLILPILFSMAILGKAQSRWLWSALLFLGVDVTGWVLFAISTTIRMENLNGLLTLLVLGIYSIELFRYHTVFAGDSQKLFP